MRTGVLLCLAWVMASSSARADQDAGAEDQAAAEALFADGRRLMQEGSIAEACRKFSESYRLDRAAGALLNLAVCHERQGKLASAWAEYRESMVDARRTGRVDREQIASESAAALEPLLPRLLVDVPFSVRVQGLHVTRDGTLLEPGSWGTALPVDPGVIEIDATAPGRKPWTTKVTIAKGETRSVAVPILAIDERALAAATPSYWMGRKTGASILALVGLAGIGAGSYLGVAALSSKQAANENCPSMDGELRCSEQGASDSRRAVTQAWASDVAIGVGGLAVVTGLVLFFTDHTPGAPTHDEGAPSGGAASLRVDPPMLGVGSASMRLRW